MNLPRELGRRLRAKGHDCRHAGDSGLARAKDVEIVEQASANNETILTHDLDYGHLLAFSGEVTPSVVTPRCRNTHPAHLALRLEEVALSDEYFIKRKLYPNVDFYSGLIYKALGIPANMFTVMFAIARTVGWVAQWMEMIGEKRQLIGRPRQVYTGPAQRDYVPVEER